MFGFGTLLPVINVFASVVAGILAYVFLWWSGSSYWFAFILPQTVYPIASVILFRFLYGLLGFKVKDTVKRDKSGIGSYLLYLPSVMLVSFILSQLVACVFDLFSSFGIDLPTVSSAIPDPSNAIESVALIVVMAVLPALCEEFIFRFTFIGMLSPLSRGGAIVISSLAFGLMHGTLEQIFFAFGLGLCMAFVYVYTGNYRIPIAIHFVNNFISCISIILSVYLPEDAYYKADEMIGVAMLVCGIISTVILLLRKKPSLPKATSLIKTGEALILAFKAPLFWVFTAVYAVMTAISTLLA